MKKVKLEEREIEVIKYVENEIKKGRQPSYIELQKKFNIAHFNINLNKIYSKLGINFLEIAKKRPNGCNEILKKELIEYVKDEIRNGHYPSRRELEKKFRVKIGILFGNIENLYIKSGSKYIKKENQYIKQKKAKLLLDIANDLLTEFSLEVRKCRKIHERGFDIIAVNMNGEKIGVELKAYNKFEALKPKDILQIIKMLNNERITKGILITTTSKVQKNLQIPKNIKLITFDILEKLLDDKIKNSIDFIRDYSVHVETEEKLKKRQEIIDYFKEIINKHKKVKISELSQELKLHFYTYFESVYDLYKSTGITLSAKSIGGIRNKEKFNMAKNELLNNILNFLKEEVKKGHYPSGEDIRNKFEIGHIWNITSMSDLYRKLGLPTYLERKERKHHPITT
jgi:hypothetical protein